MQPRDALFWCCHNTIPAICMHTPHHKQHCAQRPIFLPVSLLLNCNKKSNSSSFSELQQVVDAIFWGHLHSFPNVLIGADGIQRLKNLLCDQPCSLASTLLSHRSLSCNWICSTSSNHRHLFTNNIHSDWKTIVCQRPQKSFDFRPSSAHAHKCHIQRLIHDAKWIPFPTIFLYVVYSLVCRGLKTLGIHKM